MFTEKDRKLKIFIELFTPCEFFLENYLVCIVGCGDSREAEIIKSINVNSKIYAIDSKAPKILSSECLFSVMDASSMEFKSETFNLIYSYHVLEHIDDYKSALREIYRVLRTDGVFILGVPNKYRAIGYINSSASLKDKFKWNVIDYQKRLLGKFENRFGAHAGFAKEQIMGELQEYFPKVDNVTHGYFNIMYPKLRPFLKFISLSKLDLFVFPSLYFCCYKK